jgi:hypothetical protein
MSRYPTYYNKTNCCIGFTGPTNTGPSGPPGESPVKPIAALPTEDSCICVSGSDLSYCFDDDININDFLSPFPLGKREEGGGAEVVATFLLGPACIEKKMLGISGARIDSFAYLEHKYVNLQTLSGGLLKPHSTGYIPCYFDNSQSLVGPPICP